jgi:hypothetical protein
MNMDIKKVLEMFADYSLQDLRLLKQEINKLEFARNRELLSHISTGNLQEVKRFFDLGVNWDDANFWKDIYRVSIDNTNMETLDYLINGNIPNIKLGNFFVSGFNGDMQDLAGYKRDAQGETYDSSFIFKQFMKSRVSKSLQYASDKFNEDLFLNAEGFLGEKEFSELLPKAIRCFSRGNVSKGYDRMHQYIIDNDLTKILLFGIHDKESYDFFFNKKEYINYLNNASDEVRQEIMTSALEASQLEKIKALHNFGISLSVSSKKAYSDLFMKSDEGAHKAQEYVINHIEDVRIGNHVILKTMLHKGFDSKDDDFKINLIQQVLEQYSDEDMKSMPVILNKRELTPRVMFATKYYDYRKLKSNIDEELKNNPGNDNQDVKKLKI